MSIALNIGEFQMPIGSLTTVRSVRSSLGPFRRSNHATTYPKVVARALGKLFMEYNQKLQPTYKEWGTDYQYCNPTAFAVQIDMVGLTDVLLAELAQKDVQEVTEVLRGLIFEIDSSIAMYPLLERLFPGSNFGQGWRSMLDNRRRRFGKPIALLAVTQEKYDAILATEFGLPAGSTPSSAVVQELTGFDALLGPDEFYKTVTDYGECPYTLFVRSSQPVSALRKPGTKVDHPLLDDPGMRRLIRANAITLNVDAPSSDPRTWVNDTKAYMHPMRLGFQIFSWEDLTGSQFQAFLRERGVDPQEVTSGNRALRAKPLVASYGGYGHLTGAMSSKSYREKVRRALRERPGGYVVQPELQVPIAHDPRGGVRAGFIDRIFIGYNGRPYGIGGFRNYMPVNSSEFKAGRIHGNGEAFWGEIKLPRM